MTLKHLFSLPTKQYGEHKQVLYLVKTIQFLSLLIPLDFYDNTSIKPLRFQGEIVQKIFRQK